VAALIDFIKPYLMPRLVVGCIYALGAIGISLLFGILRFAHFAHGDMMTLGAYWRSLLPTSAGARTALPIAIVGRRSSLGLDRAFYNHFDDRRASSVIASFGVMLMLRSAIQLIWGVDVKTYYSGIVFPMQFGMLKIAPRLVIIVLVTAVLVIALHLFLGRTRLGKAMRAVSDDPDLARVSGINVEQVVRWTWIVGAGLGGRWRLHRHADQGSSQHGLGSATAAVCRGGAGRDRAPTARSPAGWPSASPRSSRPIRGSPTIRSSRRAEAGGGVLGDGNRADLAADRAVPRAGVLMDFFSAGFLNT
jgi:predicted ABC-type sugar transport system permease subunit